MPALLLISFHDGNDKLIVKILGRSPVESDDSLRELNKLLSCEAFIGGQVNGTTRWFVDKMHAYVTLLLV